MAEIESMLENALVEEGVPPGTVYTADEIEALFAPFLVDMKDPEYMAMEPQQRNVALFNRHKKLALSYMRVFQSITLGNIPIHEVPVLLNTMRHAKESERMKKNAHLNGGRPPHFQ